MSATSIQRVLGRRVWDSRGRPTVEAEVQLAGGARGRAIAPAGASRGRFEAVDLRDGGPRFGGLGVSHAVANVNGPIAERLRGMDGADQAALDAALIALDGTRDKSKLGANATIAVSLAALQAAASAAGEALWRHLAQGARARLPMPMVQIFGGGAHAGHRLDLQDFLVVPVGADSFDRALEMAADVYHAAGRLLHEAGHLSGVADEGGWWPDFPANAAALDWMLRAISAAGYRPGEEVGIALDLAASQFYRGDAYHLAREGKKLGSAELGEMLTEWAARYPILSFEDPFAEEDWAGMAEFTKRLGGRVQIVGDDLLVTNIERIAKAASARACNAALIKPNQAGTVSETRAAFDAARAAGFATIASGRSGETEDASIVHLACGWDAGQLKVGAFARSERVAKWNEGLRIAEALGQAEFAGRAALAPLRASAP